MEIYHRGHSIIIVHTATWKDLTKWNEENTIVDWINNMGRIVEHVFPLLSRLRREGQRMKKILYHSVLGCTWLYLAVLGCTWLYQAVIGCTWLYQTVLGLTGLYLAVLGCTRLWLAV